MKTRPSKIKMSSLTREEQIEMDKKYRRFHRKYFKNAETITHNDLEKCRVAFMDKLNIEQ